ncbi:MAG: hypothetical protein PHN57_08935 [Candidatus Omnitrophica bacterium]|nr:hypothetical protein [Candidatus Omnitrophota bacterium]
MSIFTKVNNLFRVHGFWKTALYSLGIVSEKLCSGVSVVFVYKDGGENVKPPLGHSFEIIRSLGQLGEEDKNSLLGYKGKNIFRQFEGLFSKGHFCAVCRVKGSLGSMCWAKPIKKHFLLKNQAGFLIRQCFTLPGMRGKGLYPATLNFLAGRLKAENTQDISIIIESAASNYSSIRGIQKAGFAKAGIEVFILGVRMYLPRLNHH